MLFGLVPVVRLVPVAGLVPVTAPVPVGYVEFAMGKGATIAPELKLTLVRTVSEGPAASVVSEDSVARVVPAVVRDRVRVNVGRDDRVGIDSVSRGPFVGCPGSPRSVFKIPVVWGSTLVSFGSEKMVALSVVIVSTSTVYSVL